MILSGRVITPDVIAKLLALNERAQQELDLIESYAFNIFVLSRETPKNELTTVVSHIFAKERVFEELRLANQNYFSFIKKVEAGYRDITYHNAVHAADLCQTFYQFWTIGGLRDKCQLDKWDLVSYILAGACHDYDHPGFSNLYLVETKDPIALRYND